MRSAFSSKAARRIVRYVFLAASSILCGATLSACGNDTDSVTGPGDTTGPQTSPWLNVRFASPVVTAVEGHGASVPILIYRMGGYEGPVALSTILPAGITATLDPEVVPADGSRSMMTLTTDEDLGTGDFPVVVIGRGTGVRDASTSTTLNVIMPKDPIGLEFKTDFLFLFTVQGGTEEWEGFMVTRNEDYKGPIELTMEGLPQYLAGSFSLLTPLDPHRSIGSLIFTASPDAPIEKTDVTIRARGVGVPDAVIVVGVAVAPPWGG